LDELDLHENQLTSLPTSLFDLDLMILSLHHNNLTSIQPEIGQLDSLEELYLSHNKLTTLPPSIVDCVDLEILTLSNNQITHLPPLNVHVKLFLLTLAHNPLEIKPPKSSKGMFWLSYPSGLRDRGDYDEGLDSDGLDPTLYPNTPI